MYNLKDENQNNNQYYNIQSCQNFSKKPPTSKIQTNAQLEKANKEKILNGRKNNKETRVYEKDTKKDMLEVLTLLNKANVVLKSKYSK